MSRNPRLSVLKKIETLYGLVEQMHSVALVQASLAVREAESAIAKQCELMRESRYGGREALLEGDRERRVLTETQQELAGMRRQLLETVRLEREGRSNQAREEYALSRVKSEQMKSVVAVIKADKELIEGRRIQAASDDRFLSRLRWNKLRFEGA
jgi:hypothetical protein